MITRARWIVGIAVGAIWGAACTASSGTEPSLVSEDGGADVVVEAASGEACDEACRKTALSATFGGSSRPLDRAQFGLDEVDAGPSFHVEAHQGGIPECPTENSPSPDRTIVFVGVPRGGAGSVATTADGVRATYLDFKGDHITEPLVRATAVTVTVVARDASEPPAWVAFDVSATFENGSVRGHVYATFCQSLSL